jgi:hypothetical protein
VWAPRWRALARRFGGWRTKRTGRSGDVVDGHLQAGGDIQTSGGAGGLDLGEEIAAIVIIFVAFVADVALFWWVLLPLLLIMPDVVIVLIPWRRRSWRAYYSAARGRSRPRTRPRPSHHPCGRLASRPNDIADSLHRGLRLEAELSPLHH